MKLANFGTLSAFLFSIAIAACGGDARKSTGGSGGSGSGGSGSGGSGSGGSGTGGTVGGEGGTGGTVGGEGGTGGSDPVVGNIIVPFGSTWKYLDDGMDPGQAWRGKDFDDAAWQGGPARIGFDTTVETATHTNDNGGPPTTLLAMYLRHSFTLANPKFTTLTLELIVDDGAVMYLNGKEIARDNMPPGELSFSDTAIESHSSGTSTETDINYNWDQNVVTLASGDLANGKNVVAAEVHNIAMTSTDLGFDLQITAN